MQTGEVVNLLDIPSNMIDAVIGKNGVNIYKILKNFGITVRIMDKDLDRTKVLVISVQSACNYILDIIL